MSQDIKDTDAAFRFLQMLIYRILMITDGRTTDILEALMDEPLSLQVIRQEQIDEEHKAQLGAPGGAPYYVRESLLVGEKSGFVVSHNIALVSSKYVPPVMFEAIASKHEGIGQTIRTFGLQTWRKIVECGWANPNETVDLFHKPVELCFPAATGKAPYKIYSIHFGPHSGIYLLEYYNPDMINRRVKQELSENG